MLASGTKVPIPTLDQAIKAKDDPGPSPPPMSN
jgi:hypothetical protein